ncbi:MAG: ATP-dependent Clp protease adaptor ClpS [Fimbriimonadaceae bacterium]|nr:ATP-dependent Clp protease adaptor ClpS [Fimbriimonadaceae bacterium]
MNRNGAPARLPRRGSHTPPIHRFYRADLAGRQVRATTRTSAVAVAPERLSEDQTAKDSGWKVVVYNNETNSYEEVMTVLILATACSTEEAYIETWEIDHYGSCAVHRAAEDECRSVAEIIGTIGIAVAVEPES